MKFITTVAAVAAMSISIQQDAFAADAAKGKQLFAQRCAMCHGDKGAGDGALAATMPEGQRPRNLQAGAMKYATDDTKLAEVIKKGGMGVGLSVMMPGQTDLSDAEISNLVAFVTSLKKK